MSRQKVRENQVIRKVTLVGAVLDLLLGITKILVGWVAQSQALVADGVHSLSDVASDAMVLFAARESLAGPDEDHPYGHDRIQTLVAVVLAALLATVALGIAWHAIDRLLNSTELPVPQGIALVVAAISALSKEAIYHYTMTAARKIDSRLLRANAWHSRSDALSSVVVLIAVAAAMLGWNWADVVGSVIIAAMIMHVAWEIARDGIHELVDTGVDSETLELITRHARSIDGVVDMHDLRTRRMGSTILADLHIHVSPSISVSEGHRIGEEVYAVLKSRVPRLSDIVVHIDPEDDQDAHLSANLPLRMDLEERIFNVMETLDLPRSAVSSIQLHYLAGQLDIELAVANQPSNLDDQWNELESRLKQFEDTRSVSLLFHAERFQQP